MTMNTNGVGKGELRPFGGMQLLFPTHASTVQLKRGFLQLWPAVYCIKSPLQAHQMQAAPASPSAVTKYAST